MTASGDQGYIECSQQLLDQAGREWTQLELLKAAKAGELRNTGWPMGLVLENDNDKPKPTSEGIEARIKLRGQNWQDYWTFRRDGNYYVIRILEEENERLNWTSSEGHPERMLWFDLRIWRIAEVVLHSATIYKGLAIPSNEPYLLAVNHGGMDQREFYVSSAARHVRRGRVSQTREVNWNKEVTQDYVTSNLHALVREVASNLFVMFDFQEIESRIIDDITNDFLGTKR